MFLISMFNTEPSLVNATQRRACLTFGAILKNLRQNGNTTLALQLVHKLEETLGHHNECKFLFHSICRPIKRQVSMRQQSVSQKVKFKHVNSQCRPALFNQICNRTVFNYLQRNFKNCISHVIVDLQKIHTQKKTNTYRRKECLYMPWETLVTPNRYNTLLPTWKLLKPRRH